MLNLISWKQFIEGLIMISASYYLVILAAFYRKELKRLITNLFSNLNETKNEKV
jgi:hypothetical protein